MLGLTNRAIEVFLRETYGENLWRDVARKSGVDPRGFNSLRNYPDALTSNILRSAASKLGKAPSEILEDTGSWLVRLEAIRRLLRFSGSDFSDFVHSLEDLPGRARMALPELEFPTVSVTKVNNFNYLICGQDWPDGFQWVLAGALRGMTDDYGVLALIEANVNGVEMKVIEQDFAASKPFEFAVRREG